MLSGQLRKTLLNQIAGVKQLEFSSNVPTEDDIRKKLSLIEEFGLYLHIPFCDKICPYCPYNKEVFIEETVKEYIKSLKKEIDFYATALGGKPVTTFYIGGGTPSTLIDKGLEELLEYVYKRFNMQCGVHMESHPNHLTESNLDKIESYGVEYLSIGVEALQEHHLRKIERPYTVDEVCESVSRAVNRDFECVNIDYIFNLPGQTSKEIIEAAEKIVDLNVDQVAAYPLFNFNYTRLGKEFYKKKNAIKTMFRRRKLLKLLESEFYNNGYERSSVWAFTKTGIDKYCSVTVPLYIGLGASGSSYLDDVFYINTFSVEQYNNAMKSQNAPIALSLDLSEEMQMAGWLYWRIYETKFLKSDFKARFNMSFEEKYGRIFRNLQRLGYSENGSDEIRLTDRGAYWIHAFEDFFSIDYINKLWGRSKYDPWPEEVKL